MIIDIEDFFLSSAMNKPEYMTTHTLEIPEDIVNN